MKNKKNNLPIKQHKITILGIGNTLYSDEGVGVHVLPFLEEDLREYRNVEIIEGATEGIKLLEYVENTDYLIIIDAINAGQPPGSFIKLTNDEIPAYYGVKMSVHQIGFQEVLFAARIKETLPKKMVMYGIQPEKLELGLELSERVKVQLPELAARVVGQVEEWCNFREKI